MKAVYHDSWLLAGYGLVALAGLAAAWAAARVHAAVPVAGPGGVALAFAVAQGFVLVRVGFSAATYAFALGASREAPSPAQPSPPGTGHADSAEPAEGEDARPSATSQPSPPGTGQTDSAEPVEGEGAPSTTAPGSPAR